MESAGWSNELGVDSKRERGRFKSDPSLQFLGMGEFCLLSQKRDRQPILQGDWLCFWAAELSWPERPGRPFGLEGLELQERSSF